MRARLADERGFTLVELLAALVVGSIVLFAGFGLLDTAVRLQARSVDALDASDRGRLGIDRMAQGLQSRICVGAEPSIVEGRDDRVEFYASVAPESATVRLVAQRRRLTFTGTSVREEVWQASPPTAPPEVPPASTTAPASSRVLVSGVQTTGTTPVLRYYARTGARLPTPLSVVDRPRVARVEIAFTARGKRADVSTDYATEILDRTATCGA